MRTILTLNIFISFTYVFGLDYCKLKCTFGKQKYTNTGCKCEVDEEKCGENPTRLPPTQEVKDHIVLLHNRVRNKLAAGKTRFRGASNIPTITYDDDLQYTAQCWTDKCIQGSDICRRTVSFFKTGQNYFKSDNVDCNTMGVFKTAIDAWYSEIDTTTEECLRSYNGCSKNFTQMIWAKTTHVGCGRIRTTDYCSIVCNYGPAGNMQGEPVYQPGILTCDTSPTYRHLCRPADEESLEDDAITPELLPQVLIAPFWLVVIYLLDNRYI